ncbi:MAG: hypothetical protein LCH37_06280 [Bacteroidetes bacterium]|nr:hypothetical protein [Bacteroidota bacterium]
MKHLIYLGCVLFIFACSKEKDCSKVPTKLVTGDRILPDSERTYLPYTGTETLVFVSNKGDTAILKGTGEIQKYTKERIVSTNEYPSCPQTEVHRHETLAAEFKGTNPNFSHFKMEQFMSYGQYSIFRFYYNNRMERVKTEYPYEWDGRIAFYLAKGNYELSDLAKKICFRGDSILAFQNYLFSWNYPTIIYYHNLGVIGCQVDTNTLYVLQ